MMKIEKCEFKFHYVKTYPNWKLKICNLIKVTPVNNFYVELDFFVEGDIKIGDVIRFDNCLQARVVEKTDGQIAENKDVVKCKCFFYETMPVSHFSYGFKSVCVVGRPKGE